MTQDSVKSLQSEFFQKLYNGSSDISMEHEENVIYWTESTLFLLYTFFSITAFVLYMNCQKKCLYVATDMRGSGEREALWSQEDASYVGFILVLTTWFSGALSLVAKVPWWVFFTSLSVLSTYVALMFVTYLINKCRSPASEELRDVVVEDPRSRRCSNLLFHRMQCRAAEDQDQYALGRIDLQQGKQSKPKKTQ